MNVLKTFTAILVFAIMLTFASNSYARFHTYHSSLTLINYDERTKAIEITIQLFTHDLVKVLETKTRKKIDLDQSADENRAVLEYLNDNFVLVKNGEPIGKLQWVGMELKVDRANVYVEIPYEGKLLGMELKNTIFFEFFPQQTNLVTFEYGDTKADLVYKQKDTAKPIEFRKKI